MKRGFFLEEAQAADVECIRGFFLNKINDRPRKQLSRLFYFGTHFNNHFNQEPNRKEVFMEIYLSTDNDQTKRNNTITSKNTKYNRRLTCFLIL